MVIYLRTCTVALLFSLLNTACNSTTEEKSPGEKYPDTISIVSNNIATVPKTKLKEMVLNEKTVIADNRLHNSRKIGLTDYRSLSLKMIDSTAGDENGFSYHIVDTLLSGKDMKIVLIGREYESENFIWIAIYDGKDKLVDHKTVYYDNAEGFLSVETVIKNNQLTITTLNEYAEQKNKLTEVYHLDENNKMVKF